MRSLRPRRRTSSRKARWTFARTFGALRPPRLLFSPLPASVDDVGNAERSLTDEISLWVDETQAGPPRRSVTWSHAACHVGERIPSAYWSGKLVAHVSRTPTRQ